MEQPTKKFRNRIYHQTPTAEVMPGDVIMYVDGGTYTRFVKSVATKSVMIEQPKGLKPKTKRIDRKSIKRCWRWYKKT